MEPMDDVSPEELIELAEVRAWEQFVVDELHGRQTSMRQWRESVAYLDDFLDGRWSVAFPSGRVVVDTPKIDNRAISFIESLGNLAGNTDPTIRVDPPKKQGDKGKPKALRRERVNHFYWQDSNMTLKAPLLYMDLIATGIMTAKVWPNFGKPRHKRFPKIERVDPRTVWIPPYYQPGDEADDVIVHKVTKLRTLLKEYPMQARQLLVFAGKDRSISDRNLHATDVEVVEYYSTSRVIMVALLPGNKESIVTLENFYNESGCNPIKIGVRPTADGRLRGHVDPLLPVIAAENRLMTYVLDYADQMVFAPIGKRGDVVNAEDFGPGAIIDMGEKGEVVRIPPANPNNTVFAMMANLQQASREQANVPASFQGIVNQSIASGQFVNATQGSMQNFIGAIQKVGETFFRQILETAQRMDRTYCDEEKNIEGLSRGGSFSETYRPGSLLKDTSIIVMYGLAGGGVDGFNRQIRMTQAERSGYVSKQWVRENMEGVDNPIEEENRIEAERFMNAVLIGLEAAAANGDLVPLAEYYQAKKEGRSPLEVLPALAERALSASQQGAGDPLAQSSAAQSEAEAMQAGGLQSPGVAAAGAGRPELSSLLAVG